MSHRLEYPAQRVSQPPDLKPAIPVAHSCYHDRAFTVGIAPVVTLKPLMMI